MKKILLAFFIITICTKAQVVFCPPGAEWHYLFETRGLFGSGTSTYNEKIKYVRDSVVNGTQVKVLQHQFFYYSDCFGTANITLIKQNGDTVFFRNSETLHNWQVLYNYAATAGQSWTNTFKYGSLGRTYTVTVDSVSTFTLNSLSLRRLYVKYDNLFGHTINERLGANGFLFNFRAPNCDGPMYKSNLCYSDNNFSTVAFSSFPCNYENILGVKESGSREDGFIFYPNPAKDYLMIDLGTSEFYKIRIYNCTGTIVREENLNNQKDKQIIELNDLPEGIYFMELSNNDSEAVRKRFIISR